MALSTMPCCPDEGCSMGEVTTEQSDSHTDKTEACSPFYSCAACVGFTISGFYAGPVTLSIKPSSHVTAYAQHLFPQPMYAIWQPPKIA